MIYLRFMLFCFINLLSLQATEIPCDDQDDQREAMSCSGPPTFSSIPIDTDLIFEQSPDFVCQMSLSHLTKVNDTWSRILGWSQAELLSLPLTALIHPEDLVQSMAVLENLNKLAPVFGFENRYRCQDGHYRSLYWLSLSEITSSPKECFGLAYDLTLTKQNALEFERLNQSLQRKNMVLTAASKIGAVYYKADPKDAVLSNFPKYRVKDLCVLEVITQTFMNLSLSQACSLSEVTYQEDQPSLGEAGWYGSYTTSQQEELQPFLNTFVEKSLQLKKPLYKNQFLNSYHCLILPLPIDDPKFAGFIVLVNNTGQLYTPALKDWLLPLTEKTSRILEDMALQRWKREAEQELETRRAKELTLERENREKAESANRLKTSFVSHMSHEIRTPLNGILGFLELAQGETFSEQGQEYLSQADKSAKFLLVIANDILDMVRIESQTLTLQSSDFNVHHLAEQAIELSTLEAKGPQVPFKLTIDPLVPQILRGDETRIQQIFTNLISNALKFTPQGKIEICLQGKLLKDKFQLQGMIKDTGIGMNAQTLNRLFQPFSQGDNSIMRQFGGTGLGLYITKQLCQRMNGDITVTSEPKVGSTFTFHVELDLPAPVPVLVQPDFPSATVLPPLSILVAEDNLMNQKVIRLLLERLGCKVDIVVNGQEAIKAAHEHDYDVILMDGEMPVMDGLEATRYLRKQVRTQHLPIIGVSAHAMPTHAQMFLEAGMNGYLAKPIKKDVLAAEILRCLALNQRQEF